MLGLRKCKFGKDNKGFYFLYNVTKCRSFSEFESSIRYLYLVDKANKNKDREIIRAKKRAMKALKQTRLGYEFSISNTGKHVCKFYPNEYGVYRHMVLGDNEYDMYLKIVDKLVVHPILFPPVNHRIGRITKRK